MTGAEAVSGFGWDIEAGADKSRPACLRGVSVGPVISATREAYDLAQLSRTEWRVVGRQTWDMSWGALFIPPAALRRVLTVQGRGTGEFAFVLYAKLPAAVVVPLRKKQNWRSFPVFT